MPLPQTKTEAISNLFQAYKKLDLEYEDLDPKDTKKKDIQGSINACDLLAYQIGWGNALLSWERDEQKGKAAQMPIRDYKWNQLGEVANFFYEHYKSKDVLFLRRELKKTVNQIEDLILSLDHDEIFTPRKRNWTGEKWPMIKWIQINSIAPYKSARTKIRRWKKTLHRKTFK